ncbi:hypothetical protein [Novosphingobium jiangmenense]|uniref:Uncharacterized protein n=1 Tax=Novosphingobium jiangmenense TaxID=2791981 RepID=A0ABS0HL38_9SPHN|nr:hypothetical protein [Novosphingobium jiangmenense]MBF9152973.1 hypothetical protein [Novosphingobium jiangmenense]
MTSFFEKLIDKTSFGGMKKLEILIEGEYEWGGYARVASDISDRAIGSFFARYGTTERGFKKFDDLALFMGYYHIPHVVGTVTAHIGGEERIAAFQRIPLFKGAYKNVVLVKSYESSISAGNDLLSLMAKAAQVDEIYQKIKSSGGLPVHSNTKSPI